MLNVNKIVLYENLNRETLYVLWVSASLRSPVSLKCNIQTRIKTQFLLENWTNQEKRMHCRWDEIISVFASKFQ